MILISKSKSCPSLMKHINDQDLSNVIESGEVPCTLTAKITTHPQNFERIIKHAT